MTLFNNGDGDGLRACPVGLVPLGWPDPTNDLDGFLRQVKGLGYVGIQFGDPGPEPAAIRERFQVHGLELAEHYFPIRCTVDGPAPDALEEGLAHLEHVLRLGGRMLVAAIDGSPDRDGFAGRAADAPGLAPNGWRELFALLDVLATRAADAGVDVTFHPHAGTYVETPDETDRLLEHTDPERVGLCLDTGHWIVGGGDPIAAIGAYGTRLGHLHLKNVDGDILAGLRDGRIGGLTAAVHEVVFGPLDRGVLPLRAFLDQLAESRYRGWLMVEQDSFVGSPVEAAAANRAALATALDEHSHE